MTVEQLAQALDVTVPEALALCRASGIAVTGPESTVTDSQAAHVRDVLEGRVPLGRAPSRPGARVRSGGPSGSTFGAVVAVVAVLAVIVGGLLILRPLGGSDRSSITVGAGDCFDADLLLGTVFGDGITSTPCSQGEFRAYAVLDLDEVFDSWPGADAVEARGAERCPALAEGRVESDGFAATTIYWFGPSDEAAWEDASSHKVVCAVRN